MNDMETIEPKGTSLGDSLRFYHQVAEALKEDKEVFVSKDTNLSELFSALRSYGIEVEAKVAIKRYSIDIASRGIMHGPQIHIQHIGYILKLTELIEHPWKDLTLRT